METFDRQQAGQSLSVPNAQGNVWFNQNCPAFTARADACPGLQECWYCRYADFHLDCPRALDVGVCNWPKVILA